jgi:hypothetical protein
MQGSSLSVDTTQSHVDASTLLQTQRITESTTTRGGWEMPAQRLIPEQGQQLASTGNHLLSHAVATNT